MKELEKREDGLIDENQFTKEQAELFCLFLIEELQRHEEDIDKIKQTIYTLSHKHHLEIGEL